MTVLRVQVELLVQAVMTVHPVLLVQAELLVQAVNLVLVDQAVVQELLALLEPVV